MISFRTLKVLISGAAAICVAVPTAGAAEKLKALIVTGQNNHDWTRTTPMIQKILEDSGRFQVTVSTTPPDKAPDDAWAAWKPKFEGQDVVVSDYNGKMWPEKVKADFTAHVRKGGGVVLVHAANNSFGGWTEFEEMTGLLWRDAKYGERVYLNEKLEEVRVPKGEGPGAGHGKQHAFQMTTVDTENPIFKGMPKVWMHQEDELYHGQRGPAKDMHILAAAFSSTESGGTGVYEPMVWWIPFGTGKVVTILPGHLWSGQKVPPSAYDCVGFRTLLQRSSEWAATGKVSIPVPKNFPTADAVSLLPQP